MSLLPSTGEILRSRRKKDADGEIIEDVVEFRSDPRKKQGFSQHMIELANSQTSPCRNRQMIFSSDFSSSCSANAFSCKLNCRNAKNSLQELCTLQYSTAQMLIACCTSELRISSLVAYESTRQAQLCTSTLPLLFCAEASFARNLPSWIGSQASRI